MLPIEIPGLGKADEAPSPVAGAGYGGLTPEDYFVLSRVDGTTTVRQICHLVAGMANEQKAIEILKKLKASGVIRIGAAAAPSGGTGSHPPAVAVGTPKTTTAVGTGRPGFAPSPGISQGSEPKDLGSGAYPATLKLPPAEIDDKLLAEPCDLDVEQKRRILHIHTVLPTVTHFELLGLSPDADKKDIKRNYFRLSKEFHPDRFYNKNLASYREKLNAIFTRLTHAFETLSDDGKRAAYVLQVKARRKP